MTWRSDTLTAEDAARRCDDALAAARRVLVIGGYGCGNTGDEAILSVLLRDLRREERREVRVVSADPRQTTGMHSVDAVAAAPASLAGALRWCDALVIGGGGIFSGYMGTRSMALPALALAAEAAGRTVVFRALGAYDSTPRPVARALVAAMQRARFVSVRDEASVDALRRWGLDRAIVREPDPALRLARRPYNGLLPDGAVGLAFRRVRDPLTQHRIEAEFVRTLNALVEAGRVPVLLPFCAHPSAEVEEDLAYAQTLRRHAAHPDAICIAGDARHPGELLDAVSRLDAIVAMRFHAIVFAHVARTPVLALPYDDKCASFVHEHHLSSLPLASVTARSLLDALPFVRASALPPVPVAA